MKSLFILSLAVTAIQIANAEEICKSGPLRQHPNHVTALVSDPLPITPQYGHKVGIGGYRLMYERTKNEDIYLGADVFATRLLAKLHYSNKLHFHIHKHLSHTSFIDLELRAGYNFLRKGKDHFTPFAGVGFMNYNVAPFKHAKLAYTSIGFKYLHELNTVFGWGINIKAIAGRQISNRQAKAFGSGADIGLPVCFRFAKNRKWDMTLEPYYIYIESDHQLSSALGTRFTLSNHF